MDGAGLLDVVPADHDPADVADPALQPRHLPDRHVPVLHPGLHDDQRPGRPEQRDAVHQPRLLYREAFAFSHMGYGAAIAWLLFVIVLVLTLALFALRPEARLLRRRRAMSDGRRHPAARVQPTAARSPGATASYLGKASITMFALLIISAPSCCRCCTWSRRRSSSRARARRRARRSIRPSPLTGTYQGEQYPIYAVPIDGTTKQLMLIEKGRESSIVVDPNDPTATPIEWQGRWRTLEQAWTFAPLVDNFTTGVEPARTSRCCCGTRSAIAMLSTLGGGRVVDARRLRLRPLPVPGQEHRCSSS